MEKFKIYSNNKGFVLLECALQEVTLVKTVFTRNGDKYTATTFFSTCNGGYSKETSLLKVYSSPIDYEKAKEMPFELVGEDVIKDRRPEGFEGYDFGWILINGEPQQIDLTPNEVVFNYLSGRYEVPDHVVKSGNVYKSREECLSFNTYDVKHADGTITERKGAGKLLMLDDDQKQLLKKFEEAYKALRESGVSFFNNYDETRVFNIRELQNYEVDYMNEDYKGFEKVDIHNKAFECPVFLAENFFSDDAAIFVERK